MGRDEKRRGCTIETLKDRLRKERERYSVGRAPKGKTIARHVISELLGLDGKSLSRYERGESEPSAGVLKKLAELYDVSADYLLGLKDERK